MDFDPIIRVVPALASLGMLGWAIWVFRFGARKNEIEELRGRIDTVAADLSAHKNAGHEWRTEVRERVVKIEGTLDQLPDKDTVHGLALAVTETRGEVRTLTEALKAVGATAHRVETFLLERGHA